MTSKARRFVVTIALLVSCAYSRGALADEVTLTKYPFLEWYGIWPGRTAIGEDGTTWTQDRPEGVRLAVQPARKSRIFVKSEKPWEERSLSPFTVRDNNGTLQLWYLCTAEEEGAETFVAYAESQGGFVWKRPELGIVEFRGSKANNLLFRFSEFSTQSIFFDPSAPPEERYKALARDSLCYYRGVPEPNMTRERKWKIRGELQAKGYTRQQIADELYFERFLRGATSPDGLRWTFLEEPIARFGRSGLDSQNIAAYDPQTKKYVAYLRRGKDRRRSVVRSEGDNFRKLGPAYFVFGADTQDPISDDVYASGYCRYPGTDYHVMFPAFYHRLTSQIDVQLAISRNGIQWTRPERTPIISTSFEEGKYGMVFAHPNLVPLNDEDWGVVMHGNRDNHDWGERYKHGKKLDWRWATWKRDRLVGLEAPVEGKVTLVGRICHGEELRVNFKTQKEGGWVKIELVDPPTSPPTPVRVIEGYSRNEAELLTGDRVDKPVSWNGKTSLSALKGRKISIRIYMARAKIFSVSL